MQERVMQQSQGEGCVPLEGIWGPSIGGSVDEEVIGRDGGIEVV